MYPARVISDTYLNWGRFLEDEIGMEMHDVSVILRLGNRKDLIFEKRL